VKKKNKNKKPLEIKEEKVVSKDNAPQKPLDSQEAEEQIERQNNELSSRATNIHLRRIIESNYIEYASYVIKDRAIPDINDGLKPVQRRILWSLHRIDDGRFHKVANVVGHCMQFHPHGDQSIYGALVVLANTDYFIDKQGNFGNIFTGDEASAARYIECRLTELARQTLFNGDITDLSDSYDGRNKEPVYLPSKIPSVLLLGQEGIAPGMTTRIFSHNFKEVLEAQISVLKGEEYKLYPDFRQGGIMDVSDYQNGVGKITLRAKIEIEGRKLIIREIPATTNTSSLIASIEKAANANKIKITSINDFTAENVEIEIIPQRGYDPEKALNALYAYTDCSVTVFSNILVIKDKRPEMMTVDAVLRYCTDRLVEYLKRELEIEQAKLRERLHDKTLAQIFIENRIYKSIEECETYDKVLLEVRRGLEKFKKLFVRALTDEDIEKLLVIPIKRISLFDINRNKQDMDDIVRAIEENEKNLKRIKNFTIKYISALIDKFAKDYPRRTKIEAFDRIDVKEVALNNIKVGWDRRNCLIGTDVKSDETITCNEYDKLLCIEKSGGYKLISIPEKLFVGKLFYLNKHDRNTMFNLVYRDNASGVYFAKRTAITKFITDKEYNISPPGTKIELINAKPGYVYECIFELAPRQKQKSMILNFENISIRSPKSKGLKLTNKKISDFKFISTGDSTANAVPSEIIAPLASPVVAVPVSENKVSEKSVEAALLSRAMPKKEKKEKVSSSKEPSDKLTKKTKIKGREQREQDDQLFELKEPEMANEKKMNIKPKKEKKKLSKSGEKKEDLSDDWGRSQPDLGF
jgi:topoisomerase-4 subunit A